MRKRNTNRLRDSSQVKYYLPTFWRSEDDEYIEVRFVPLKVFPEGQREKTHYPTTKNLRVARDPGNCSVSSTRRCQHSTLKQSHGRSERINSTTSSHFYLMTKLRALLSINTRFALGPWRSGGSPNRSRLIIMNCISFFSVRESRYDLSDIFSNIRMCLCSRNILYYI